MLHVETFSSSCISSVPFKLKLPICFVSMVHIKIVPQMSSE